LSIIVEDAFFGVSCLHLSARPAMAPDQHNHHSASLQACRHELPKAPKLQ
jgi:hypothetical protein